MSRTARLLRVAVWTLAAVFAVAIVWSSRLGTRWPSVYYMTGPSMEPTVKAQEYFLAWSPAGTLGRGDLVIFRYVDPDDVLQENVDGVYHVLRRLVAFGGDTVSMRAGVVSVNGVPQSWPFRIVEPAAWRSLLVRDSNLYTWGPWIVPADSIMLLSDTRDVIGFPDSRFIGFVSRDAILARVTRTVSGRRLQ